MDSNVLISLIQDEFGKGKEFMSYRVRQFLDKALSCVYNIVISNWVIDEVRRVSKISTESLQIWIDSLDEKIEVVICTQDDIECAKRMLDKKGPLHFSDAVHAVIYTRCKCETLVTWNLKDFENSGVNAKDPREL